MSELEALRQAIIRRQERREIRRLWCQVMFLAVAAAALAAGIWRML